MKEIKGKVKQFISDLLNKIKKITRLLFHVCFGAQEDIQYKLGVTFFILAWIFFLFALVYQNNFNQQENCFTTISAMLFLGWIFTSNKIDSCSSFVMESARILFFFMVFLYSAQYCLNIVVHNDPVNSLHVLFATVGLFSSLLYFVCKIMEIFCFIKNAFIKFTNKLFGSEHPASSKIVTLLQNCTAFLVSIGGFGAAIVTLLEIFEKINK